MTNEAYVLRKVELVYQYSPFLMPVGDLGVT